MTPLSRGIISSGKLGGGGGGPSVFAASTANLTPNDYLIPTSPISSGLSTISFYTKIKFDVIGENYVYFEMTNVDGFTGFGINMTGGGVIVAAYRDLGGTYRSATSSALSASQYYSLIVTIDVANFIKIYADNVEIASTAVSSTAIFSGAQFDPPTIGAAQSLGVRNNHLNGSIGFMGSNSRIITPTERASLLTSRCYADIGTLQTGIINYWELAEYDGKTEGLVDQAGSNTLTNSGAVFDGTGLNVTC